jgi:Cu/Ag efflux protein CusF
LSLAAAAALLRGQSNSGKKSHTLRGKIESIDAPSKSMTVNHGKVEGWMEAMTMKYKVDNADVFHTAKVGDTIEATVYDGDYTLYKVHVVKDEKR